jgi:hypothetical protein
LWWSQREANQPVQPTRATEPNGKLESSRRCLRG